MRKPGIIKRINRTGALWLALGVVLAGLGMAASAALAGDAAWDLIGIRAGNTPSFSRMEELRTYMEEELYVGRATAWVQQSGRTVSSDITHGSAKADALWFDGTAGDIVDVTLLHGSLPGNEPYAAAIDELTAVRVFGSARVEGKILEMDGYELEITGVFTLPEGFWAKGASDGSTGIVMVSLSGAEDPPLSAFTHLDIALPHAPGGVSESDARSLASGIGVSVANLTDRSYDAALYAQWSAAPLWLLCVYVLFTMLMAGYHLARLVLRRTFRQSRDRLGGGRWLRTLGGGCIVLALMSAAAVTVFVLAGFDVQVPAGLLPTQWSDLEFWPGLIEDAYTSAYAARTTVLTRAGAYRDAATAWAAFAPLLSIICLIKAVVETHRAQETRTRLFSIEHTAAAALLITAPLLGALASYLSGFNPVTDTGYTFLPIAVFVILTLLGHYPPYMYALRTLPIPGSTGALRIKQRENRVLMKDNSAA